ncbi:MAG: PCI domain-containing protein [Candidatus Helarchaeota archaeon]|nr:PCI domain-containing protein [Candidatus Helarchaeota archaeon]
MKRRIDLFSTANDFKLAIEYITFTLTEMLEEGTQHGIIDKENRQFYHLTENEHQNLLSLLSRQKVPIQELAQQLEFPINSIKDWLNMLVQFEQLKGTMSLDDNHFIPQNIMLKEVKESFQRSGRLGIREAANALFLPEQDVKNSIQLLKNSKDLIGFYTTDNEYFITQPRLDEDIIDFLREERRFPLRKLASTLNMNDEVIVDSIEKLVNEKQVSGAITQKNEFISDELLDEALVDAIRPYSRISISELAQRFGFTEQNMKLLIARAISKGLVVGSIDSVSNEFIKESVIPTAKPLIAEGPELIDVKRDYDYIGGDIRFKVALRNITKTTVSKISVLLSVPDQFQIDRNVEKVEILNPNETRGVDFIFTPLACGKGQIFGTVSYTDAFGEPHSVTVRPKEVWVKCPLVKSQLTSSSEADLWKTQLQKSTTTIDSTGIPILEAFQIGCEQIAALDLAEVGRNEVALTATFSGIAKVTGNRLIVEVSMATDKIVLDIYTSDQKQATGFLAYMRNLIKISLDVSRRLRVKSEKLGVKVLSSFQITQGFFQLCDYCEMRSAVCDFILQTKEIIFKIKKEFPEIKFVPELESWVKEFSNYDENVSLPDSLANILEYDAIEWLKEIESLAENTAKIYLDSFDTPDLTRDEKINGGLQGIRNQIEQKEANYSIRVAHYLLIIYKLSGLCLYSYKFSPGEFDPDLLSGFLQAIQSFGTEFSASEEAGMRRLSYKDFEITLEESQYVRVALVGIGKITTFLEERLKDFITLFSAQFREELAHFTGHVGEFRETENIIKNIFGVPQAQLEGGEK